MAELFIQPLGGDGDEESRARELARRYRCEFVNLNDFKIHHELFKKVPV